MLKKNKLITLKLIHTLLWLFIICFIGYIWYAGIFDKNTKLLWVSIVIVISEGVILLTNGWKCPLTKIAFKYAKNNETGFDIYLPKWFAKYNISFFTIIAILGIMLVIVRVLLK